MNNDKLEVPRELLERVTNPDSEAAGQRARLDLCDLLDAPVINHEQKASDHQFYIAQLQARAANVLGLDPENTSWFEVVGEMEKAAAQPQVEPVAWLHTMHENFNQVHSVLTFSLEHPFGTCGISYDPSYAIQSTPLFTKQPIALYARIKELEDKLAKANDWSHISPVAATPNTDEPV